MEAVLKVGGSLAENPDSLVDLCQELGAIAEAHRIAIVPGGGEFADTVRKTDKIYNLSEVVAHKMAVLAMDQYGFFLSDIIPKSHVSKSLREIRKSAKGILPILLPSEIIFREDPLKPSWDVTSDTIAAYIAELLEAKKLVIVTNVNGIFSEDPKKALDGELVEELSAVELLNWNKITSVDKTLPKILLRANLDCYIVNGKHPKRIKLILENKKTVCTHVTC
ncbi:MAG: delta 1-pyrroline-5-carboxylate synthetase [Candidatus Bathyarchaeota archaeon]|nr:delta 1-pyrroline-5-carboxylate synthetase [Candidatus Bathyarchaeota archaeon]